MTTERVSTIRGTDSSVIVIVPHGFDDPNTSVIAESIIDELGCYGVINRGWERADTYDYFKDKANCNNIVHCQKDVVKDEFFDPIVNYCEGIMNRGEEPNLFIIHGVSNSIRNKSKKALDIIVGKGNGNPPSHTCDMWYGGYFMQQLEENSGFVIYEGKAGGNYSGRGESNLNQLFRSDDYYEECVFSLQLEIIRALRDTQAKAILTGAEIAKAIEDVVELREADARPDGNIDWEKKFPKI